jgi:hypothetical protein
VKARKPFYQVATVVAMVALVSFQGPAISGEHAHTTTSLSFTRHPIDTSFTVAGAAYSADLDEDGDIDVIGGAWSSAGFAWWENNDSGSFTKHPLYTSAVREVYATDVNGDGHIDILRAGSDSISWYENDGSGGFTSRSVGIFYGAWSVHAADLDKDGDTDVLGTSHGGGTYDAGRVAWWENDGHQTFTRHILTGSDAGRDQHGVFATDLDSDGDVDILCAVGYPYRQVYWFENDGHANFIAKHVIGSASESVYAIDIDGDQDVDVLTSGWLGKNNGMQEFTWQDIGSGYGGTAIYPVDLDSDGDTDVISESAWSENDGNENFTAHRFSDHSGRLHTVHIVHAGDLDGDRDLDIVAPDASDDDSLVWWESNASDSWPDFELQSISWSPNEPEVMEDTYIEVVIRNLGPDYDPASGVVYLDLALQDTDTGDKWFWRFPGDLDTVLANDTETLTIDRFWFTRDEIDKVEACVSFEDGEANLSNNCIEQSITVHPNSSNPWRECLGIPIDALVFFIDGLTAGSLSAAQEAGKLYLVHSTSIFLACNQAGGWPCQKAVGRFFVDAGVTIATEVIKSLAPHKVLITLIKDGIFLFDSSQSCGESIGHFVRAAIEEARHHRQSVNAVVARSPIYIRVIDSSGRRAGFLDNGDPVSEIPDAEVAESNGTKVVLYPGTDTASIELTGTASGTFDLLVSISVPNSEVHTVTYEDVYVTTTTSGEIDVASGQYTLALDDDGDGTTDRSIQPTEEIRTHIHWVYLPAVMKSY